MSQEMDLPPLSGAVFIFFSKNRQQVKLLRWDTDGFTLYQKRLERGTFEKPYFNPGKKACVMLYKTLSAIMSGISLKSVRYRKRLNIDGFTSVKRKFLDCGDDFDAKVIVRLINFLYHKNHKHKIGEDGWTERDNYKWRQQYAIPVMHIIKKKLDRMAADNRLLPKTEKYEAVHYMLNEWDALMNTFTREDYHLDNNLVERLNRYISLSRRNSLFFGSYAGAKRSAMFYSLACSCRLQGINFFEYISDVINKAATLPPRTPLSKYRELLPDKWKQKNIAQE